MHSDFSLSIMAWIFFHFASSIFISFHTLSPLLSHRPRGSPSDCSSTAINTYFSQGVIYFYNLKSHAILLFVSCFSHVAVYNGHPLQINWCSSSSFFFKAKWYSITEIHHTFFIIPQLMAVTLVPVCYHFNNTAICLLMQSYSPIGTLVSTE